MSATIRATPVERSSNRVFMGDSTHDLANVLEIESVTHAQEGVGHDPETITSIGASGDDRRSSEAETKGIRVKYEVNLDFSDGHV